MNSKYSNILTILLVVVIIAILGIIGFLGYKYYTSEKLKGNAENFVDSFINESDENKKKNETNSTISGDDLFSDIKPSENNNTSGGDSTASSAPKFEGYLTSGTIEIPATNIKLPILAQSELSKSALEKSVIEIYGNGLNQEGNTTIAGHNYRNGKFFSNNKKLNIGDKIYITDLTGTRLSYTIYNKYEAEENESDYMTRDTQGAKEISLSTCTDDGKNRLIIWAKAD